MKILYFGIYTSFICSLMQSSCFQVFKYLMDELVGKLEERCLLLTCNDVEVPRRGTVHAKREVIVHELRNIIGTGKKELTTDCRKVRSESAISVQV